jgi:hypothetical protein
VPAQNGVVERKNRTLVEMARMMLDEHKTPRRFWADGISIACYMSNRSFPCLIMNLTPFELRFGCKLSISHLRPFGYNCFILKHGNLDKFESHSSDRILLGYTHHGGSYRVLNLETNTIVESCDVTLSAVLKPNRIIHKCTNANYSSFHLRVFLGLSNPQEQR